MNPQEDGLTQRGIQKRTRPEHQDVWLSLAPRPPLEDTSGGTDQEGQEAEDTDLSSRASGTSVIMREEALEKPKGKYHEEDHSPMQGNPVDEQEEPSSLEEESVTNKAGQPTGRASHRDWEDMESPASKETYPVSTEELEGDDTFDMDPVKRGDTATTISPEAKQTEDEEKNRRAASTHQQWMERAKQWIDLIHTNTPKEPSQKTILPLNDKSS